TQVAEHPLDQRVFCPDLVRHVLLPRSRGSCSLGDHGRRVQGLAALRGLTPEDCSGIDNGVVALVGHPRLVVGAVGGLADLDTGEADARLVVVVTPSVAAAPAEVALVARRVVAAAEVVLVARSVVARSVVARSVAATAEVALV